MNKDLELIKTARDIIQTHTNYEFVKFQYDDQKSIIGFTLTNKVPKKMTIDNIYIHRVQFEMYDDAEMLKEIKAAINGMIKYNTLCKL